VTDLQLLCLLGKHLDDRPPQLRIGQEWLKRSGKRVGESNIRELLISGLLKIRDKRGCHRFLVPNRTQWEFEQRATQRNIVLKSRQVGMTTYIAARFFISTITRPGTVTVLVAHDQESAEAIFQIVKRFWDRLPGELQQGALKLARCNVRAIAFAKLDSEFRVATAADENAGRGLTIHNLHCSEVSRWPEMGEETLLSLQAAVPPEGAITLESTPQGAAGLFYNEWLRAEETGYVRHFFPWWLEPAYKLPGFPVESPTEEELLLMEQQGLTVAQIAYRRTIKATYREKAAQEYAEDPQSCFLASSECAFDLPAIEEQLRRAPEPPEKRDNGRLQVWLPPAAGRGYILGVDPAGGGATGDCSCVQVIDRLTGLQCAELLAHLGPAELAPKVAELAREYNGGLIAIERNNHGHAVLAHLMQLPGAESLWVYQQGGKAGWLTNVASRPRMLAILAQLLESAPELFNSARLLGECRTFVRGADGSPAAAAGAHDDSVMAMALAHAVRAERAADAGPIQLASLPGLQEAC